MNDTLKTIHSRTSTKAYTDTPVSKEDLKTIVDAGKAAPSGMNRQPWAFLVVQDPEMVKTLSKLNASVLGMDKDPFYGAPAVIAVLTDPEISTHVYDGSLAMENMLLAAESLGLGACWIHRAKEVFNLPEGKEILKKAGLPEWEGIGFCIVGTPKIKAPVKEKKGLEAWL
jgi:nitroreductase